MSKTFVSKFVVLPDGTRLLPFVLRNMGPTNEGVQIGDGTAKGMVGFIKVADENKKLKVLDLLDECATRGKKFVQPDWSFLNEGGGEQ